MTHTLTELEFETVEEECEAVRKAHFFKKHFLKSMKLKCLFPKSNTIHNRNTSSLKAK